jgi:hypothetical protein
VALVPSMCEATPLDLLGRNGTNAADAAIILRGATHRPRPRLCSHPAAPPSTPPLSRAHGAGPGPGPGTGAGRRIPRCRRRCHQRRS